MNGTDGGAEAHVEDYYYYYCNNVADNVAVVPSKGVTSLLLSWTAANDSLQVASVASN